ncbi:hypothetical protein [Pseudomonas sp.]|uniref:hypothetical protein n=1 Tax=Pseudomonas sp. TaxID=306 RepID=UPI003BB4B107
MTAKLIYIPKKDFIQTRENVLTWQFGTNPETTATIAFFELHHSSVTDEKHWSISGSTGTMEEENFFGYLFAIPYTNDAPFNKTYTLKDGLTFSHGHSSPGPGGFYIITNVDADEATLKIDIHPTRGIAKGTFEAKFKSHGYRTQPKGTFKLLRNDL